MAEAGSALLLGSGTGASSSNLLAVDSPTPFCVKPTLIGSRVVLRPFTGADIEAMGQVLADPDVLRLTGSVHTTEAASGRSRVLDDAARQWYSSRAEQINRLDLAIVERTGGQCVGEAVLNEWQPENQSCNFRILIGPSGATEGSVPRRRGCSWITPSPPPPCTASNWRSTPSIHAPSVYTSAPDSSWRVAAAQRSSSTANALTPSSWRCYDPTGSRSRPAVAAKRSSIGDGRTTS